MLGLFKEEFLRRDRDFFEIPISGIGKKERKEYSWILSFNKRYCQSKKIKDECMTGSQHNKKTILLTKEEASTGKKWFLLDASGKTLGRFSAEVAKILRGKHKPNFTFHTDGGDGVIVINASKIKVTGAKAAQKIYRYHTGAMGGMREIPYKIMLARKPEYIIRKAVSGMMPKTRLAKAQMKKLRIFAEDQHDLQSQQPVTAQI